MVMEAKQEASRPPSSPNQFQIGKPSSRGSNRPGSRQVRKSVGFADDLLQTRSPESKSPEVVSLGSSPSPRPFTTGSDLRELEGTTPEFGSPGRGRLPGSRQGPRARTFKKWQAKPVPPLPEVTIPSLPVDLLAAIKALKGGDVVSLNTQEWGIGDAEEARDMCLAMKFSSRLRELTLSSNRITARSCAVLAKSLVHLHHLQLLDLSGNAIRGLGMHEVAGGLKRGLGSSGGSLHTLYLRGTELGDLGVRELGFCLSSLKELTSLNLRNNAISQIGARSIAKMLPSLPKLQILDIGNNRLSEPPLEEVVVAAPAAGGKDDKKGKGGKDAKKDDKKADKKDAKGGKDGGKGKKGGKDDAARSPSPPPTQAGEGVDQQDLDDQLPPFQHLATALARLTHLEMLDLGDVRLGEEGGRQLAGELAKMTSLRMLSLRGGKMGNAALEPLVAVLPNLKQLQMLDLADNNLVGEEGGQLLAGQMKHMTTLELLDLQWNQLGPLGVRPLTALPPVDPPPGSEPVEEKKEDKKAAKDKKGAKGKKGAKVEDPPTPPPEPVVVAPVDPNAPPPPPPVSPLGELTCLKVLNLGGTQLGREGAEMVSSMLGQLSESLSCLNLADNRLGVPGTTALAQGLATLTNLQELYLSYNQMATAGVRALCPALKPLQDLAVLDLGSNMLGNAGIASLAERLSSMTQLESLMLNQNGFNQEGMKYLAEVVPKLEMLSTLSVARNGMGEEAIAALASVLPTLPRLKTINIGHNSFGEVGMQNMTSSLKKFKDLSSLDVKFSGMKDVPGIKSVKKHLPNLKTYRSSKEKSTLYLLRPLSPPKRMASRLDSRPRPFTAPSLIPSTTASAMTGRGSTYLGNPIPTAGFPPGTPA